MGYLRNADVAPSSVIHKISYCCCARVLEHQSDLVSERVYVGNVLHKTYRAEIKTYEWILVRKANSVTHTSYKATNWGEWVYLSDFYQLNSLWVEIMD